MTDKVDKLKKVRPQILFIELAGLLHDIGKLSKAFLEYRQAWQDDPHGYNNDPHDHEYFNHEVFKKLIPKGFSKTITELFQGENFGEPEFSIQRAVHSHIDPAVTMSIVKMLKAADGVDSAIDRNNPLWCAEQKIDIFRSNVFGYESGRKVSLEDQEKARQCLYIFMNEHHDSYLDPEAFKGLDGFKKRRGLLTAIEKAFSKGISDTCRPQNDTTLWEHSYAVASILKVLAVHNLFRKDHWPIYTFEQVRFGILGVGWDGMRFISYGQKIGDITGRKRVVGRVQEGIKKLIEYEIPIGNEIYADDSGIYFIVPANLEFGFSDIWTILKERIQKVAADESAGEIQPVTYIYDGVKQRDTQEQKGTRTLTSLVKVIEELEKSTSYPFNSELKGFDEFYKGIFPQFNPGDTICPICRMRKVESNLPDEQDLDITGEEKKVCEFCFQRRVRNRAKNDRGDEKKNPEQSGCGSEIEDTVYIDEIADSNGRAALIAARFGLREWLNGKMVRSLFVTEANGIEKEIENLGNVKQFVDEEREIKKYFERSSTNYNYSRIQEDIDAVLPGNDPQRARYTSFLYGQRVRKGSILKSKEILSETKKYWSDLLAEARQEHRDITLYNLMNAKTPTPSTILDVWETTHRFFRRTVSEVILSLLPKKRSVIFEIDLKPGSQPPRKNITYEGEIDGIPGNCEFIWQNDRQVSIVGLPYDKEKLKNASHIRITNKQSKFYGKTFKIKDCKPGKLYNPSRTITISPNLFIAIVPADRALEITALIYQKYVEHFGKVMGRLPFSVGNVFFDEKMPMFVVLDAAKRMIANFDSLAVKAAESFDMLNDKESSTISCHQKFDLKTALGGLERRITWRLPDKLGNCEQDYYHPLMLVEGDKDTLARERKTFFETVAGNAVHFSGINEGDKLNINPNYYDFEFLDSNTRRYDIDLNEDGRRRSNVANFQSKPVLLDELDQKIVHVWKHIFQGGLIRGLTDTKLRNLQALWLTKYREWDVDLTNKGQAGYRQWWELVHASLKKELNLKTPDGEQFVVLQEMLNNGLLFDTLELFLGIMKERISKA